MNIETASEQNLFCEYADSYALASTVIDDVIAAVNRGLWPYGCTVSDRGRQRLVDAIALIHVEFYVAPD
jgi:hypothetical protein